MSDKSSESANSLKSKTPFEILCERSLPLLKWYSLDLTKHDRECLAAFPGVPFLHWTRPTGTHLEFLPPFDSEMWPKAGEDTPHLFSRATREEILVSKVEVADYWHKQGNQLVQYFNGRSVLVITEARALQIAQDYRRSILHSWQSKRNISAITC